MNFKRIISIVTAITMIMSVFSSFTVTSNAEENVYVCDFGQLVKNSADTTYGTEADIFVLDEYTKAYLTYEGTYVSADEKVYLSGATAVNGAGKYKQGSYIAFTAPSAGTISVSGNRIGYCVGNEESDEYKGYGNALTYELEAGEMIFLGQRGSTYISELTFTPKAESSPSPSSSLPSSTPSNDEPTREVIYQENFESYANGDDGSWTSPAGTVAVKTDSDSAINKYLAVTSGKSGTARSGYKEITAVSENFVLEADIKSTAYASNVSAFEVLEQKSSLYMNHGCYSNGKYIFKMNRPAGLNRYVINNTISDSGLSVDRYTQPTVVTGDIPDEWLHVKVIGNFDDHTATAYITSLDKKTVYYHGRTDMSSDISSFGLLALLAPSSGVDTCIDNIKISKALESDLNEVFYTAVINDGISEFSQYVYTGESVTNIPDVSVYGEHFLGWDVNGTVKTSDELDIFPIRENVTITAKISSDYIENIASVEFNSFPTENQLVMGPDGDTYADNEISLTITGEKGTSLVTNPDLRVTDYKIDWKIDGFRIMNGNPTGESGAFPGTQLYCDSYGRVTVDKTAQSSINFELKNTSANYYGTVTAAVTYNGKTITVSKPLLLLADTVSSSDILLPKTGYTADYNKYDDALVGYRASSNDILTGGWSTAGSDVSYIDLKSDSTGKYLSLSRALSGNSSYIYNEIGDIKAQTVFKQDIRFGMSGAIAYGTGKSVTEMSSTAFELAFSSTAFTLNGSEICVAETGKWYHIEITADPTTKLCFAKIYNLKADGDYKNETPIAVTEMVDFKDGYTQGAYYRINLAKERNSVDINNVTVKKAQIDETSIIVTAPETLNISESGSVTADFSVTAKTTDGDNYIGMASWKIADEFAEGVTISSTGADTATLTVDTSASSGDISVECIINGVSVIKTIKLLGTKDNVAFVEAPLGALIPAGGNVEYTCKAEVRNGNAETVSDRSVTYVLYNEKNTEALTTEGITLSEDGKLTVSSTALPQTVCIVANSVDESGNPISRAIKVNVYGLKFDFGTNVAQSGYTKVTSEIAYSDSRGFGVTGTLADNASSVSGSDFGFKVKLEKGEVYNVTVTYSGTVRCEKINSDLTGFERTKESLSEDSYQTAVFGDGILDITFSGNGEIDKILIEKVEREVNSKPAWWTIGDSTVQQNGSWAYTIANESTTDLSKYPELANVVSAFYNSGRAGRQHRSYYTEGLLNNVLCGIKPGDVVSISGMGTNDSSSSKEDFKEYNNIYIDAIKDMGAYVILASYTPTGNYGATEGKVYDADNILFKGMRTNSYDAAIREVYAERVGTDDKILGFIDIGVIADNLMTNDVRNAYNMAADEGKTDSEARAEAQAKASELMSMWKDYNHYYTDFSNYILPEITTRAAKIISGEKQNAVPEIIELKEAKADPILTPVPTEEVSETQKPTETSTPVPTEEVSETQKPIETSTPTPTENIVSTIVPTALPTDGNTINVVSKSIENGFVNIKIGSGFKGIALAAMYDGSGVFKQIIIETDNTVSGEFKFTAPSDVEGYIVKLMNWDSLSGIKPYGKAIEIALSEIGNESPAPTETAEPINTEKPSDDDLWEVTSKEEYIDVSKLQMYGNATYRMYKADGSYEEVSDENGKVHNQTGEEVTIVPVYRFEFTNTSSSTDEYINGYVKVKAGSYSENSGYGLINSDYAINENGCKPIDAKPIKADVADGFYDILVYRKGGTRADVYNNGVQIINNTTSSGSQNRPSDSAVMNAPRVAVTDGINLTFGNTQGNNERIASVEIVRVPDKYAKPVIWIAGDSESATYYPVNADGDDLQSSKIMMTGFGMQLGKFLSDKYALANYGQPSATVKTWYTECFESVNTLMQKGDTIIIDFGINEVASSSNGISVDEMKQYMQTIIEAAKEKGVTPILVSPVYNGKYQHKSYFTYNAASKENAMYEFAKEMGIECIDLNKYTQLYVNEAISQTGDENWRTNNYHVADNLHLTQHSALLAASLIAAEMKTMGYETDDYEYTYKDISAVNTDDYTQGAQSGVTRVYSVAEAEKFIASNTEAEPVSVKEWDFATNQTMTEGDNVIVVSGTAVWNEANQNIKFDANSKTAGTTSLTLNPAISNNVTAGFDLNIGALGGQNFAYSIVDSEGNNLVNCNFDAYNATGSLIIGSTAVAEGSTLTKSVSTARGDGMSAATTSVSNEIDFDNDTVTVTIGQTVFSGKLTGDETGSVSKIEFISSRSKTADRSIYLDNISIKEYESKGSSGETAFAEFESELYQVPGDDSGMPYRYYLPEGYDSEKKYPAVIFLHGETRKGSDNESQMYNAQYLFNKIIDNEAENPCILIAPQCATESGWTKNTSYVNTFVEVMSRNFSIDSDRIYLVGYGEGADGCYKLASYDGYAGVIAMEGAGEVSDAQKIEDTAVMIINGSNSENAAQSRKMANALISKGLKNIEYVELYGEESNILKKISETEGVLEWMFTNKTEEAKVVDLAIFMGQSNMAGRGDYEKATTVPVGHGYEFRSVTQPDMLFNITGPFGKLENNDVVNDNSGQGIDRRNGDMVSSVMESYYNETGIPIVGVQCSRGGTNTGYWTGSAVKAEAQARFTAAKTYLEENGYTINNVFMVWCQGETDGDKIYSGSQSVEGYKSATLSIFEYMKEAGVKEMFIVQTGHYNGDDDADGTHDAAYVSINEAQASLAEENDDIYTVGSFLEYKDYMIDSYHFNQTAYNQVGTAAGKAIARIYAE